MDDASIGNSIQMLGKYTLLDTLGSGAAGVVYHAHLAGPMGFRKQVALKTIPSSSGQQEAQIHALINEARLGGHLEHPNIVSILDFGEVEGTFYIAMEYVQGHTLRDVVRRAHRQGPMAPAVIAGVGVQICRGLSYAHTATDDRGNPLSLIHRDLKPANVMITRSGQVKVLDFGISRATSNLYLDRPGETAGTPAYMSPEQTTGQSLDCRSDLFSLASLIAEMITGEAVFADEDPRATLHRVNRVDTASAKAKIREILPSFLPVLEGAWAQDPRRRYPNADRMAAALHRASRDAGHRPAGEPKIAVWLRETMSDGAKLSPTPASSAAPAGQGSGGLRGLLQRLDSWARRDSEPPEPESPEDLAGYSMDDSIILTQEPPRAFSVMHELRAVGEAEETEPEPSQIPDSVTDRVLILSDEIDREETATAESGAGGAEWGDADESIVMDLVAISGEFIPAEEATALDSTSRKGIGEEFPGLTTTEEIERVLEDDDVLRWIEIRPGTYWRGSDDEGSVHRQDEVQHEVTLSGRFLVANVPVTRSLWDAVMGATPSEVQDPRVPIAGVSWFDTVQFCNVYSRAWGLDPAYRFDGVNVSWDRESMGFRLLTEAEWEYAARAGQAGPFAGADDPLTVAWFAENARGRSRPVATRAANAWGLYDTCGNGWEWVWDRYDPRPEQGSLIDPMGHWSSPRRVARGGSWSGDREDIRTARRRAGDTTDTGPDLGLRIARSLF